MRLGLALKAVKAKGKRLGFLLLGIAVAAEVTCLRPG